MRKVTLADVLLVAAMVLVVAWLAAITVLFPPPAFAVLPPQLPHVEDEVDMFEVNHFFDGDGRLIFDQLIFWEINGEHYDVVSWRLIKRPEQMPVSDQRGGYVVVWRDGELMRRVNAATAIETWTQYDPEATSRDVLAKELRRELRQPPKAFRNDRPAGAIRPFVREFPATQ
jgi:hypothetical protein